MTTVKTVTITGGLGPGVTIPVMLGPKLANGGFWGWQR